MSNPAENYIQAKLSEKEKENKKLKSTCINRIDYPPKETR